MRHIREDAPDNQEGVFVFTDIEQNCIDLNPSPFFYTLASQ